MDDGAITSFVPEHDLATADPVALRYNGYHDRGLNQEPRRSWATSPVVGDFVDNLSGSTVVGLAPAFATKFLREATNRRLHHEPWYHVMLDLPTYAAGLFGWERPASAETTISYVRDSLGFGIPYPDHSAANDVHTARELHRALRKLSRVRRAYDISHETRDMDEFLTWKKERRTSTSAPAPEPWCSSGSFSTSTNPWAPKTLLPGDTFTIRPGALTWTADYSTVRGAIDIVKGDDHDD